MKNPKEDPEEKKYLAVILKKLEDKGMCDMDWDENDVYESANKELNYKRYHIDKKQLGKLTNQTTEKEGFVYAAMCLWAVCYSILFATVLVVTISNNVDCYSIVCVQYCLFATVLFATVLCIVCIQHFCAAMRL